MRMTTVLRKLTGVNSLVVKDFEWNQGGDLVLTVSPRWRRARCGGCYRITGGYDRRPARLWKHLSLGSTTLWLRYAPRRVQCPSCGIRTERVPWATGNSRFTGTFEELAAYLSQITDRTKVTELLGVAWATVGDIVQRVVERRLDEERLDGLVSIGIDEFSYRKRHNYLTVVVDHQRRRVVWAGPGRTAETLGQFFELLGPQRRARLEMVTIDMAAGYQKALATWVPHAQIVYDRFHVQRLAADAVDTVRRQVVAELQNPEESRALKNTRFALLKNPWNLSEAELGRLAEVQRTNPRLYRAYLLHQTLAQALDYRQPWRARRALKEWLSWASRSRLKPFVRVARTVRKHLDGILAYVHTRLTNGLVEGINNKLRTIARRAFGFHSAEALIAMLFLTGGGIQLNPPLPTKT